MLEVTNSFPSQKKKIFLHFKSIFNNRYNLKWDIEEQYFIPKNNKNVFSNAFSKVLKELGAQVLQDGISRFCKLHCKSQL